MSQKLSEHNRLLFEKLHNNHQQFFDVSNKRDFRGIWNSVVDKYPQAAHFAYELLQNADDALASKVCIYLYTDHVIVKHNGKVGFSVTDVDDENIEPGHVNAITSIGNSTKVSDENTIGKFGVGFKAVFQYTDCPHIYDDHFCFKIEHYIVPTLLDKDYGDRKKGETVFYLPFKKNVSAFSDVKERLEDLGNPILFLKHIEEIEWVIDSKDGYYTNKISKNITPIKTINQISFSKYHLCEGNTEKDILMFTKPIKIDGFGEHEIAVGYYLDKENNLLTQTIPPLYCFFPTSKNVGLPLLCHAPFKLVDSRQLLKESDPINRMLLGSLSELYAASIRMLCEAEYISDNIFDLILLHEPSENDNFYQLPFYKAGKEVLMTSNVLQTVDGGYTSCSMACYAKPLELIKLISTKQLRLLCRQDDIIFLSEDLSGCLANSDTKLNYLRRLGLNKFDTSSLAHLITSEFMNDQEHKWVISLYMFLKNRVSLWNRDVDDDDHESFRNVPIIKTSNEEWIQPYKQHLPQVFLPNKAIGESYQVVDQEYIDDKKALDFLKQLGLKEPDKQDYIENFILKKFYTDEQTNYSDEEVDNDFYIIMSYYLEERDSEKRKVLLENVSKKIKIADSSGQYVVSPCEMYDTDNLNEGKWFCFCGISKFGIGNYKTSVEAYGEDEVRNFVRKLGVLSKIQIKDETYNYNDAPNCLKWQISTGKRQNDKMFKDKTIPFLDKFVNKVNYGTVDIDCSRFLWKLLADNSNSSTGWRKAEFSYHANYSWRRSHYDIESSIYYQLKNARWLLDGKKPSEVFQEDLLDADYQSSQNLFIFFGIKKKRHSLQELGATKEQQEAAELGETAIALGMTVEDMKAWAKFRGQQVIKQEYSDNVVEVHREELRQTDIFDMYTPASEQGGPQTSASNSNEDSDDTNAEVIANLLASQEKDKKREVRKLQLRTIAANSERYSKEWFDALIELESRDYNQDGNGGRKDITITFASVKPEKDSQRIYVLSKPSRGIPTWVEEVEDIETTFTFSNHDEYKLKFEVANVQDLSLRLKAKVSDAENYAKIDWSKCTKAELIISRELLLPKKLKHAFDALGLESGFNLKDNLDNHISFIFGPPGTGKTTRLAEDIITHLEQNNMRILVLAPTNTACDELTAKIVAKDENCTWLGRFMATSREELEGYVIERDSLLYKEDKCCIVSTMARLCFDGFNGDEGYHRLNEIDWDLIICDEASMIPLADIAYTIYNFRDAPIVIAGDPMQIPPISIKEWEGENIYTMVKLDKFDNPQTEPIQFEITNLETQYRSVPTIGELFSQYSYDGKLDHYREETDVNVAFGAIDLAPVNFVPFRVDKYDSVFCPKKLNGSPVHLYSAMLTVEMCIYMAKEFAKQNSNPYSIGVVSPYSAQAQLIESLLEQIQGLPQNVSFTVGTVHRFQGGQCNLMIAVFNPPRGLKVAADRIFLNDRYIINVAISRAQDNLIVMLPHKDTDGYGGLTELQRVIEISSKFDTTPNIYTCDQIEELIFKEKFHIEKNTFVTTHQLANVYTKADKKYEIRIDENSIDVQIANL